MEQQSIFSADELPELPPPEDSPKIHAFDVEDAAIEAEAAEIGALMRPTERDGQPSLPLVGNVVSFSPPYAKRVHEEARQAAVAVNTSGKGGKLALRADEIDEAIEALTLGLAAQPSKHQEELYQRALNLVRPDMDALCQVPPD